MIRRWLIERALRTPYLHLDGYMERYWLVPYTQAGTWGDVGCGPVAWRERPVAWLLQRMGIAVRVHHILRSDTEREPHDHPWSYVSVILKGAYFEHRFDRTGKSKSIRLHRPGSIRFRRATDLHILELENERQPVTTLFITGTRHPKDGWGFLVDGKMVPAKEYSKRGTTS